MVNNVDECRHIWEKSPRFCFLDEHVKLAMQTRDDSLTYLWMHKETVNILININSMYAYMFVSRNYERQTDLTFTWRHLDSLYLLTYTGLKWVFCSGFVDPPVGRSSESWGVGV